MKIDISSSKRPPTTKIDVVDEYQNERSFPITGELPMTIYLDKKEIVTLMTLGHYPEALVIGYLRNQGIIQNISQLKSVHVDWSVNSAAVTTNGLDLTKVENKLKHQVVTSGCGQGTTFGGIMDDLKQKKVNKKTTKQSTIYHLLKLLHDKNEIYRKSGAVHGCALCDDSKILDFVEDVGRHNAVDAIAGHMWLNNIDGKGKIFYTTGRLTSEMVIKVAQMNISILLSRSGITEMGLNVAKETNVTLLGRAKGKHFLVYNGKQNINFDAVPEPRPDGAPDIWDRR
ncbi:MAG: formate dehydrogenase accessory sulfurtransferase FdhD [Pseudomonadota bacterium]|nr:formate dehydrogenase accessory sulfurtransferase FdhD [Pseudomonadota bacterium]|tara:strand:+ start:1015 stop:1869 length:855 start_codon:yes stop_codon:yes gene_type:complete